MALKSLNLSPSFRTAVSFRRLEFTTLTKDYNSYTYLLNKINIKMTIKASESNTAAKSTSLLSVGVLTIIQALTNGTKLSS